MTIQPNVYGIVATKRPREVVLVNTVGGCSWHRCVFCEYCDTYSRTEHEAEIFNRSSLSNVTGAYGILQIVCSASFIELPTATWIDIRNLCVSKSISILMVESHWMHRQHDKDIRDFFRGVCEIEVTYGVDSFDMNRRELEWFKGYGNFDISELKEHASAVNLLIGVEGQQLEEICHEIEFAVSNFPRVNVIAFEENDTPVKRDKEVLENFYHSDTFYKYKDDPRVEIMDGCDSRAPDNLGNVGVGCRY